MSCFNENEKDVKKAIDSILNQTFSDYEFIIILDNPQNIKLKKILTDYEKKDKRIKLIFNTENIGLAMSLNKGIENSNYEIIARMDADDISLPFRFEKEIEFLEKHKDIDLVSSTVIVIDEDDNEVRTRFPYFKNAKNINKALEKNNFISHPCAMFRKKAFMNVGKYRNFPTAQDYDLWLRFIDNNSNAYIFREPLLKYRERNESISNSKAYLQFLCQSYIKKLHLERKKNGHDSFSETNLQLFFEENNYNNSYVVNCYNEARNEINSVNYNLRNLRFLSCLKHYVRAKRKDKRVIDLFWNNLYTKLLSHL